LDHKGIRILDLGCGLGYTLTRLSLLLPNEANVTGIDTNTRTLKKAAALLEKIGDSSKAKVKCADAEKMPFSDGYFDLVIANLCFSVFRNPSKAASEVARTLKPGGRLVMTEVNSRSVLGKIGELLDALTGHLYYMLYSQNRLANLFVPLGFRVENTSRIPFTIRIRARHLKLPHNLSPVFLIELSKTHRLYPKRIVN
jgi:ubiquinone/menaquinone biosynthesis C-methylase UbiE